MKLILGLFVAVSLHSVLGYGNRGQGRGNHGEAGHNHGHGAGEAHSGGSHRPNPYAICGMILSASGFNATTDCLRHDDVVNGEIAQVYDDEQREVFSVWIAQTAALYRADVMSLLTDDDDDDHAETRQQVVSLCERQKCFMQKFREAVRDDGVPPFCNVKGKRAETWLQEMWGAKHRIESGERMAVEMVETFFCARAHNPHLHMKGNQQQRQPGGRASRHHNHGH